jgi:hypothetical protein
MWQRVGRAALLILVVGFGAIVELRSALLERRMTDLDVYLTAGWAVRTGADIYDVTDVNCWHYQYPPLLAILVAPLADPPAGAARDGMLPFAVSVGIWYVLSMVALALAIHVLASALESPLYVKVGCSRWWQWRMYPFLVCIFSIGSTLMRGQVNLFVLALLAAMIAALIRARSFRGGLFLAGAICIKVIPAFLILVPLWRRDGKCLAGCAIGLTLGLGAVPIVVFGPARTLEYYKEYCEKLLLPGLGQGTDQSRAKELIEMNASDSQSPLAIFHNTFNFDRATRPAHATPAIRWAHRFVGVFLTLAALFAYGWRERSRSKADLVLFAGAMMIVMVLMSPVCHLHYFCMCIPAVMGLAAHDWQSTGLPRLCWKMRILFWLYPAANLLPHLPWCDPLRDLGLAMYMAILIWALACIQLWRGRTARASDVANVHRTAVAA